VLFLGHAQASVSAPQIFSIGVLILARQELFFDKYGPMEAEHGEEEIGKKDEGPNRSGPTQIGVLGGSPLANAFGVEW
jgi:hypothetical protein